MILLTILVNDILVQGAIPLFFLDYIASSKLNIEDSASFVKGCCDACKQGKLCYVRWRRQQKCLQYIKMVIWIW